MDPATRFWMAEVGRVGVQMLSLCFQGEELEVRWAFCRNLEAEMFIFSSTDQCLSSK